MCELADTVTPAPSERSRSIPSRSFAPPSERASLAKGVSIHTVPVGAVCARDLPVRKALSFPLHYVTQTSQPEVSFPGKHTPAPDPRTTARGPAEQNSLSPSKKWIRVHSSPAACQKCDNSPFSGSRARRREQPRKVLAPAAFLALPHHERTKLRVCELPHCSGASSEYKPTFRSCLLIPVPFAGYVSFRAQRRFF